MPYSVLHFCTFGFFTKDKRIDCHQNDRYTRNYQKASSEWDGTGVDLRWSLM